MATPLNVLFIPGLFGTALSKSPDRRRGGDRLWPTYEIPSIWARNTQLASARDLYAVGLFDDYFLFNHHRIRAYREGFELLLQTIKDACAGTRKVAGAVALYDWRWSPLENAHRVCTAVKDPGRWVMANPDSLERAALLAPVGAKALEIEPHGEWLIIAHSMGGLVAMELMASCSMPVIGCVCVGAPVGGSIKAAKALISGRSAAPVVSDAVRALARNPVLEGPWALAPPDLATLLTAKLHYTRRASSLHSPLPLAQLEDQIVDPMSPVEATSRARRRHVLAQRWRDLRGCRVAGIYFFGSNDVKTHEHAAITGSDVRAKWEPLLEEDGDDTVTFARSTSPCDPHWPLSFAHQKQMYDPRLHEFLHRFFAGRPGANVSAIPGLLIEPADGAVAEGEALEVFVRGNPGQDFTIVIEATEEAGAPPRFITSLKRRGTGRFERVVIEVGSNVVREAPGTFVLASVFDGHIDEPDAEQNSADTGIILVERIEEGRE